MLQLVGRPMHFAMQRRHLLTAAPHSTWGPRRLTSFCATRTVGENGYPDLGLWAPACAPSAVSRTISSRAWTRTCGPEPTPNVQ
jgi:hypothetical protein